MKVVVVGGMGFLGSHVCEMYKEKGDEVVAVDNLTKFEMKRNWYDADAARDYNLKYLNERQVRFIKEDMRNYGSMKKICKDADYIVNCAAQPAMTISMTDPWLDFSTNVIGVFNLLEISRQLDVPFAHCSTIHVYGNSLNDELIDNDTRFLHPKSAINESYPLLNGEVTPLHASKRTSEIYIQSYIDTYSLKAICLRLSGIYGPRQFGGEDHGWVANFAIRTIVDKPITIFGTDKQVRDILYVKDAANIFDFFYQKQASGIYNAGGGASCIISIKECLDKLKDITHKSQDTHLAFSRKGDLYWFVSDNSKIMTALDWRPVVLPERGLRLLVDWIENNKEIFE